MKVLILQSRLDSTRLPGKALLELSPGLTVLDAVLAQLSFIEADERILACPHDALSAFEPIAARHGWKLHAGDKEDVLDRFCSALKGLGIKASSEEVLVLRATGDNPFVLAEAANLLADEALERGCDYACYTDLPHGSGLEYIRAPSLLKAGQEARDPFEREHVCPYLYRNPGLFSIHKRPIDQVLREPQLSLTIDTAKDLAFAKGLYKKLGAACPHDERIVQGALELAKDNRVSS